MTKLQKKPTKTNLPDDSKVEGQLFHLKPSEITISEMRARSSMSEEGLKGLMDSIRLQGIIEPLIVTTQNGKWTLVAGERRLQAAKNLNFQTVPVINRPYTPQQHLYAELTENIQREDADPIAEAIVLKALEETHSQTHNQIGLRVGKSKSWVTNRIRLLELPEDTKGRVMRGELDPSSALELLSLEDAPSQDALAKEFSEHDWKRNEIRGVVRTILANSATQNIPIREAVSDFIHTQKEQPKEDLEPTTTQEETGEPVKHEQPKPPQKEICHGCGQAVNSSRISYPDSCCDECNSLVKNVLAGRRKKIEEMERNKNN